MPPLITLRLFKNCRSFALALSVFILCFIPQQIFGDDIALLRQGDKAVQEKDFQAAEKIFERALANDAENYRIIFSLAKAKVELKKLAEAKELLGKVLAMKVANGRDVIVYMADNPEPLAAELVDEIVMPAEDGRNNMRNYLDTQKAEAIPHYRLYFKKEGKMKLVPSDQVRIQYDGVLRRVHELVRELDAKVKKRLLAQADATAPVEMILIEGACFMMGSELGDVDEKPVHQVCLSPFKMDKHEVTQASFQQTMGTNPSLSVAGDHPVDNVTWDEAKEFCGKSGKRLPTEAEWEYAGRGGAVTEYHWSQSFDGAKGNFCDANCTLNIKTASMDDGYKTAAPVGSFPANPFGLYDMAGNVTEWVSDFMLENYYQISPKKDPQGPPSGESFIVRGGAWNSSPHYLRSANRTSFLRDFRHDGVGFRCAASQ